MYKMIKQFCNNLVGKIKIVQQLLVNLLLLRQVPDEKIGFSFPI